MWDIKEMTSGTKMKKIAEIILNRFLRIDAFQMYVNANCNNKYGIDFVQSSENGTIDQVFREYHFNDIQKSDIVLDIGANVGAFSIFLAKQGVKKVYAVEPTTTELLKKNIKRNNLNNIEVINECLGNGVVDIIWNGISQQRKACSLSTIVNKCGGHVDFLKCDCEGGEWCISPDELKGIRRIEAEIHCFKGMPKLENFETVLKSAGFKYEKEILSEVAMIIHAKRRE